MTRYVTIAGVLVLVTILCLSFGAVAVLASFGSLKTGLSSYDWAAVRFTFFQSMLSATLSCVLAVPLARALMRRSFLGRKMLITLLGAPFLLPAIIAVLGLLAIWGRAGLVSEFLAAYGFERLSIYGLNGILLAHVFFNLPLVTRLLLLGWQNIPAEQFRLAEQLDLRPFPAFRWIELPMLRTVLPGAFLLVFLLCMTSFAVALALGGGPKATTIELAIYQALRFEFDLASAARLALIQFAICGTVALIALRFTASVEIGVSHQRPQRRDMSGILSRVLDGAIITLSALFLGAPLVLIIMRGLNALALGMPAGLAEAAFISVALALASAALSIAMALALLGLIIRLRKGRAKLVEGLGLLILSASPFVIGTGLFIVINPFLSPFAIALPITALVNAVMGLPFALRALLPAFSTAQLNFGRLAANLGLEGLAYWRVVLWPVLRRPLGFATGLSAALSMGDLGVITLFAPPGIETLPLYMYNLMSSYRMEEAAGAALVLVALSLTMFWAFDRGGRIGSEH